MISAAQILAGQHVLELSRAPGKLGLYRGHDIAGAQHAAVPGGHVIQAGRHGVVAREQQVALDARHGQRRARGNRLGDGKGFPHHVFAAVEDLGQKAVLARLLGRKGPPRIGELGSNGRGDEPRQALERFLEACDPVWRFESYFRRTHPQELRTLPTCPDPPSRMREVVGVLREEGDQAWLAYRTWWAAATPAEAAEEVQVAALRRTRAGWRMRRAGEIFEPARFTIIDERSREVER